jgi:hypothetical protein
MKETNCYEKGVSWKWNMVHVRQKYKKWKCEIRNPWLTDLKDNFNQKLMVISHKSLYTCEMKDMLHIIGCQDGMHGKRLLLWHENPVIIHDICKIILCW